MGLIGFHGSNGRKRFRLLRRCSAPQSAISLLERRDVADAIRIALQHHIVEKQETQTPFRSPSAGGMGQYRRVRAVVMRW